MKILVTGREGQLVRSLQERAASILGTQLIAVGRPEVDLETPGSVAAAIQASRPDLVINAAAFTAVDQAEAESQRAFRINADAAGEAAAAAWEVRAPFIQISTDYVFDGSGERARQAGDPTGPLGVYGSSKLAGEDQVRARHPDHFVLRTAWVYSPFGRNFVRTMLRLAGEGEEVRVVADQRGCPTSALDIADGLLLVAGTWAAGSRTGLGSVMHVAGGEACSWAEFAQGIFAASAAAGGPSARVVPVTTTAFPTAARRPANSMLDSSDFERAFGWRAPSWRDSLPPVVERVLRSRDS